MPIKIFNVDGNILQGKIIDYPSDSDFNVDWIGKPVVLNFSNENEVEMIIDQKEKMTLLNKE